MTADNFSSQETDQSQTRQMVMNSAHAAINMVHQVLAPSFKGQFFYTYAF